MSETSLFERNRKKRRINCAKYWSLDNCETSPVNCQSGTCTPHSSWVDYKCAMLTRSHSPLPLSLSFCTAVTVIWASSFPNPSDMGIPNPNPNPVTLTLTQIAKVIWEGDAHITRVLGMGIFISLWHSSAGHLKLAHSIWSYYTSPVPRNLSVISFSLCLLHFPLERNEISREQLPYFHIRAIYDGPIDLMLEAKRCVQELW